MVVNVKDFDKIKELFAAADDDEQWEAINDEYCGPDTGIYFDEDSKEIVIADGWEAADNGDIVKK